MNKKIAVILTLAFVAFMSAPWLLPHAGFLALFGFVPLLLLDYIASGSKQKGFFWWYFGAFVLWNAATTFWVCNATVGGGIFAIVGNAAQMALVWAIFRLSKKKFSGVLPYVFLMVMWIAWERQYFHCQISWPWLTLGNAFAQSTSMVQWYELTGSLGGSLWVWLVNLGVFGSVIAMADGRWQAWRPLTRWSAVVGLVLVALGPVAASEIRYVSYKPEVVGSQDVVIAQPNFDPYHKFESMSQAEQNNVLLGEYSSVIADRSDTSLLLLLAPETFTSDIWLNNVQASPTVAEFREFMRQHNNTQMLFGASTNELFEQNAAPSLWARRYGSYQWYQNYNSAVLLGNEDLVYHKLKLVVGTELMPYPRIFGPIDDMLGGVIGRCVPKKSDMVLSLDNGVKLGCAICYESVYGEHCAEYIRGGAEFLSVITNDAWWGDTPGYKQHCSYSRLRAIETRRDIARCGNTGISGFIDSRGDMVSSTQWWVPSTISGSVALSRYVTPYVKYGDIVGKVSTFAFLLLALWLLVCILLRK